jgi:hypothetical protein
MKFDFPAEAVGEAHGKAPLADRLHADYLVFLHGIYSNGSILFGGLCSRHSSQLARSSVRCCAAHSITVARVRGGNDPAKTSNVSIAIWASYPLYST